jgi:endonuclease-8
VQRAGGREPSDRRRFVRAEAYGKHLFHFWEGGLVVHVHLGMAGWFYRNKHKGRAPEPRPSVRMRLSSREVTVDLIGPPTCELLSAEEMRAVLERLGPDPLRADADPGRVWAELRRRGRPIGDALLDQRVISGVGNIYRNEALFLSGIHPLRRSDKLKEEEWRELWKTTSRLMRRGLRPGRIATVDPLERPHAQAASGRTGRDTFYALPGGRPPPLRRRPRSFRCRVAACGSAALSALSSWPPDGKARTGLFQPSGRSSSRPPGDWRARVSDRGRVPGRAEGGAGGRGRCSTSRARGGAGGRARRRHSSP